ncbi:hypothetical protein C1H46_016110 [Malus baccata]|uniref:Uncharacterized protein n=1 Tax=Malus baccata TaxID=106549 RepID=A0A540MIK6_MALBA|nr:hypothetical protein C1H46_016110 [Malus baccata]
MFVLYHIRKEYCIPEANSTWYFITYGRLDQTRIGKMFRNIGLMAKNLTSFMRARKSVSNGN